MDLSTQQVNSPYTNFHNASFEAKPGEKSHYSGDFTMDVNEQDAFISFNVSDPDVPKQYHFTVENLSLVKTSGASSGGDSSKPENKPSGNVDRAHVDRLVQYIDRSYTATANTAAKTLKDALNSGLYDLNAGSKYDGTYTALEMPQELYSAAGVYLDTMPMFGNSCFKVENGQVTAIWVGWDSHKEELQREAQNGNAPWGDLWDNMGFTDYDALAQAFSEIDETYYGAWPKQSLSKYASEDRNEHPDSPNSTGGKPDIETL